MIGVADLVVSYVNELRHVYLFLEEARDIVEAFEMVACVAGVWKGKERGFWVRGKREGRAPLAFLSRLKLTPFPFPFKRLPRRLLKWLSLLTVIID